MVKAATTALLLLAAGVNGAPAATFGPTVIPTAAATYTTQMCVDLVPVEEIKRGKGAFYSGCDPEGEVVTGCWRPGQYTRDLQGSYGKEDEHYGCQTCIIQETFTIGSVFRSIWGGNQRDQLEACPSSFNYKSFVEAKYSVTVNDLGMVKASTIQNSTECGKYPSGTFYNALENKCYFKSDRYNLADGFVKAAHLCDAMGGVLVAIDSEAENEWIMHNLLWIGFQGETYTGLYKYNDEDVYRYLNASAVATPASFAALGVSNWYGGAGPWYPQMNEASDYPDVRTVHRSCVQLYPNLPKSWDPYSCDILQQYICELPSASYKLPAGYKGSKVPFEWEGLTAPPTLAPTIPKTVAKTQAPVVPTVTKTEAPVAGGNTGTGADGTTVIKTVAPSDGGGDTPDGADTEGHNSAAGLFVTAAVMGITGAIGILLV